MNNQQNILSNNNLRYASFGSRIGAYLIDTFVILGISVLSFVMLLILRFFLNTAGEEIKTIITMFLYIVPILIIFVGLPIYRGLLDHKGKTLGRKITKTIVVFENGSEISLGTAFVRQLLKSFLSNISANIVFILDVAFIMSGEKYQTLTDKILKTVVVYK